LTQTDLARLLGVEDDWVLFWEREASPLPTSYLSELGAMGLDTARLAHGQPGVWFSGADLPDERLLRYCWQGLAGETKTQLRSVLREEIIEFAEPLADNGVVVFEDAVSDTLPPPKPKPER